MRGTYRKEAVYGTSWGTAATRKRGEAYLTAVSCASTVGGVGSNIVGGVCRKARHVYRVGACACATTYMAAAGRRIVARAPADAALRYRGIAICRHVAAACRSGLGYARHLARRHRGQGHVLRRGEAYLATVGCTCTVGGVGSNIVGGVSRKARHVYRV